ncbi:hypothetical protein NL676_004261 [Syzygium grande]|nr:hypothetical protein NL676_004261 [Syzygium grande]
MQNGGRGSRWPSGRASHRARIRRSDTKLPSTGSIRIECAGSVAAGPEPGRVARHRSVDDIERDAFSPSLFLFFPLNWVERWGWRS